MDQTKAANFTNVQSSKTHVIPLHGQMQTDRIHRTVDLEPVVVHRLLEAIFRTHLDLVGIMRAIQVKVGVVFLHIYGRFSL